MVMEMKLRGKVRILRWIVQVSSLIFFVFVAAAGICVISMGSFRIDCIFGTLQRLFAQPTWTLLSTLFIFVLLPILGTLILGRAFCGWLCPVGTILDALSKIPRVNFIKPLTNPVNKFAVAVGFLIGSTLLKFPSFCLVCPIRGTCYSTGLSGVVKLAELALLSVPVGFEIGGKRAWCRYLCPVGAIFALLSFKKFLGFKIDTEKCLASKHARACRMCSRVCPTSAITETSFKTGDISRIECIACGKCYDVCKFNALKFGKLSAVARANPLSKASI